MSSQIITDGSPKRSCLMKSAVRSTPMIISTFCDVYPESPCIIWTYFKREQTSIAEPPIFCATWQTVNWLLLCFWSQNDKHIVFWPSTEQSKVVASMFGSKDITSALLNIVLEHSSRCKVILTIQNGQDMICVRMYMCLATISLWFDHLLGLNHLHNLTMQE